MRVLNMTGSDVLCGKKDGKGKADYLGPTKLAVSIIYIIK